MESPPRAAESAHSLALGNPWCHWRLPLFDPELQRLCWQLRKASFREDKGGTPEERSCENCGGRGLSLRRCGGDEGGSRLRKYLRLFRKARKCSFSLEGRMDPAFSCLVMHSVRGSGAKNSLGWTGRFWASFRQRSEPGLSLNPHLLQLSSALFWIFFFFKSGHQSHLVISLISQFLHRMVGGGKVPQIRSINHFSKQIKTHVPHWTAFMLLAHIFLLGN